MKLGLVGCGVVGQYICKYLKEINTGYTLYLYDRNPSKIKEAQELSRNSHSCKSLEELKTKPLEFLIEAASRDFVKNEAASFLLKGINLITLSNGVLAFDHIRNILLDSAEKGNSKIYVPGGPPGIDTVLTLQPYGIKECKYTSSRSLKHPVAAQVGPGKYFSGTVKEAMVFFNKTLNTSSVLAEAGIGYEKTKAEVVFSPDVKGYELKINVESDIANLTIRLKGPLDPSTGTFHYLAALSVVALLKKLSSRLVIGV